MPVRLKGSWDMGLKFEEASKEIAKLRKRYRALAEITKMENHRRALAYANILALQLANGLRIGEAIDCYYQWVESGEREIMVRVRKTKDRARLCIVPDTFTEVDRELTKDIPKPRTQNLYNFARRHMNINTHSLRYAFINYLLDAGVDPATVSKILAHKKLDRLVTYIQETRAKQTLTTFMKTVKI